MVLTKRTALACAMLLVVARGACALIVYRPTNSGGMNDARCYLTVYDADGVDVTQTACTFSYAWYDQPDIVHYYEGAPYLAGGMAMHVAFRPGTYTLVLTTPLDRQNAYDTSIPHTGGDWTSNRYQYDTADTQLKVIFVSPVANENGFYTGGWHIDWRAPRYWKYTKPYREYQ